MIIAADPAGHHLPATKVLPAPCSDVVSAELLKAPTTTGRITSHQNINLPHQAAM